VTDTNDIIAHVGIYGAAFVIGLVSSVVPLISAEIFVAVTCVTVTRDPVDVAVLGVLVALGQIAMKLPMYYGSRGAGRLVRPDPAGRIARALRWIERKVIDRWRAYPTALTFVSATTGIPPFYALVLLAGAVELPAVKFLTVGTIGRIIRFVGIGLSALYAS
jgi:membrane protein YqaA with SNARE-associated domain